MSASPAALAWRRLRAHRGAMLGLVVVLVVGGAVALAPWLPLPDPELARPWLGARAPGAEHPAALARNQATVGEHPEFDPALTGARVEFTVAPLPPPEEVRVALRGGVVWLIARLPGGDALQRWGPPADGEVEALAADLRRTRRPLSAALEVGQVPPPDVFQGTEAVLFLREPPVQAAATVVVERAVDGRVARLTVDGVAQESCDFSGAQVVAVTMNGQPVTHRHWLGTDAIGRDLLSRTLFGGQVSLLVGLVATAVSLVIGVAYGALAGYLGGRADRWLMGGVDVLSALPFLFLVILLLTFFGRSLLLLFIALGAVQWLTMARIVRGQVMALMGRDFVAAARTGGASGLRIAWRHLVPNSLGPVVIYATLSVPAVILQESFLAFLGLGVGFAGRQVESWGALVNAGAQATQHPWLLLVPAVAMAATLLSLNLIGDGLRDALDPRLEGR